jgi:hypothetical protein
VRKRRSRRKGKKKAAGGVRVKKWMAHNAMPDAHVDFHPPTTWVFIVKETKMKLSLLFTILRAYQGIHEAACHDYGGEATSSRRGSGNNT